jgi:photosystem II stability/assembly factor-like uncharacterized protein
MKIKFTVTLFALIAGAILVYFFYTERNTYYPPDIKKISKADLAYFRAELEYMKSRDPRTGMIPENMRERELAFCKSIPSKVDYAFNKYYTPVIQSRQWLSNGPVNVAGRIKAIEFDVENENNILSGSASGGIWRSSNGGTSWVKVFEPSYEQSIYSIEQDRREGKTSTWYCGTGELLSTTDRKFSIFRRTIGLGNGIYKSTNNGITWDHLKSTSVLDKANLSEIFQGVWDIKIDNNISDMDVVYAACVGAVMKSTDGGESWQNVIGDIQNKCFSTGIEIAQENLFYAALSSMTDSGNMPSQNGIYRSNDGETWKDITPQGFPEKTRVVKIKSAPSNPNVLYVFTETPVEAYGPFYNFAASHHTLWKYTYNPSADNGIWEDRTEFLPYQSINDISYALQRGFNSLGGYCFTFNVKPDNENTVFIGGTNLFRSVTGFADTNFVRIGGYYTSLHPDHHAIEFLPSNPNILYNGSDGGINMTNDCNAKNVGWYDRNNELITSQYYSVAIDMDTQSDETIIGGLQDQGTLLKKNEFSKEWSRILGGDGLSCFIGNNKEFVIASVYNGAVYGGNFDNDGSVSFESNSLLLSNNMYDLNFNFFTIFDVEPNNNNELYIAQKNVIHRKSNLKLSIDNPSNRNYFWSRLNGTELDHDEDITAIRISRDPQNRLYYGSNLGKVYRADDVNSGSPQAFDITGDEFPVNGYVSCISVDPDNADNVFVVFSNYNVQSIFYSSDGGASWSGQGGNLEENPDGGGAGPSIRWIEILHTDDGTLYLAGTTTGLYSTSNLAGVNTIWVKESPELIGNIRIDMITARQCDGFVVVATQGNGVYSRYITSITIDVLDNNPVNQFIISNYPNPVNDITTFYFEVPTTDNYKIDLFDLSGNHLRRLSERYFSEGKHNFTCDLRGLTSGIYIYTLSSDELKISGKLIVKK